MPKRVVIFIDGQNLYYSLKSIGLKEIDIDFTKLFADCLSADDELIRTYLFRPAKVENFFIDEYRIAINIIDKKEDIDDHKKPEIIERFETERDINFLSTEIKDKVKTDKENKIRWLKDFKQKFSESDNKYTLLSECYTDFSIERKGVLKVDPYNEQIIGEKGVDVAIAVTMVKMSLTNKLDKIILFSGDFDLSEGIKACKDNMHKVHIVKIHRGEPPRNISSSRGLLSLADHVINIYESDLKGKYARQNN